MKISYNIEIPTAYERKLHKHFWKNVQVTWLINLFIKKGILLCYIYSFIRNWLGCHDLLSSMLSLSFDFFAKVPCLAFCRYICVLIHCY